MFEDKNKTYVFALGGLNEIGKNSYCIQHNNTLIMIDAGVMFPENELPGVDYVIPDYDYLVKNNDKFKALFITHGHEDHIGGIPFLLKTCHVPVIYAPRLAAGLIKNKLEDAGYKEPINIIEFQKDDVINIGELSVSFFGTTHSIPDSYGICINTPNGRIIETGDYKIDLTPMGSDIELANNLIKLK